MAGETWVTVRYDKNGLKVNVVASAPYGRGERTATATITLPDDDQDAAYLTEAIESVLQRHGDDARHQAGIAAARSLVVASDRGEE